MHVPDTGGTRPCIECPQCLGLQLLYVQVQSLFNNYYTAYKLVMPQCTVHRRHTVVRSCVGSSVRQFVGLSDLAFLCER